MTYSDCWISTVDDTEFRALLSSQRDTEGGERLDLLPPALANNYWINIVRGWAASHALAVEQSAPLGIQIVVSREQLLQFLDEVFWRKEEARDREQRETLKYLRRVEKVERLRGHALQVLRDDKTYLIVADEF
jgi:DNA-binding transcriptional regulator YdaS (Cro superfamily)